MAITSADINNQSFSIDRKGYDVDEVDVFLEFVAEEIDALNATIARQQARISELEEGAGVEPAAEALIFEEAAEVYEEPAEAAEPAEIDELAAADLADAKARIAELEGLLEARKLDDSAISKALISAQRSAEEIIAQAHIEASQIIQDAEDDADRIVESAEKEKQKIATIIRDLEDERDDVREDYRGMLSDFVADASKKLADIEASMAAGAHGRAARAAQAAAPAGMEPAAAHAAPVEAQPIVTNQVPIRKESAGIAMSYTTPQIDSVVAAVANPTASVIEKDLSGFGDVDDDFEFGDID